MKKEKKPFIVATSPGNPVFMVNAVPTKPGRPFNKIIAKKELIKSSVLGAGEDLSKRILNDTYHVSESAKMTYGLDDVILHEGIAAEVAAREASLQLKEALEELKKLEEDIVILKQNAEIYAKMAEEETLNFDKEGKIIIIDMRK